MLNNIMIMVGGAYQTWSVMPYIQQMSSKFARELHFVGLCQESEQINNSELKDLLDKLVDVIEQKEVLIKKEIIYGNSAEEIPRYIESNHINMVVASTGNFNKITQSLIGITIEGTGRGVSVPFLMVPAGQIETNQIKKVSFQRILVPLDASEIGEKALPYAEYIARKMGSFVSLIYVVKPPVRGVPVMHKEVIDMSRVVGKDYIEQMSEVLKKRGTPVGNTIAEGDPAKAILKCAKEEQVDLIVMCTSGLGGLLNWVFGSVTKKVLDRTKVPALIMRYTHN